MRFARVLATGTAVVVAGLLVVSGVPGHPASASSAGGQVWAYGSDDGADVFGNPAVASLQKQIDVDCDAGGHCTGSASSSDVTVSVVLQFSGATVSVKETDTYPGYPDDDVTYEGTTTTTVESTGAVTAFPHADAFYGPFSTAIYSTGPTQGNYYFYGNLVGSGSTAPSGPTGPSGGTKPSGGSTGSPAPAVLAPFFQVTAPTGSPAAPPCHESSVLHVCVPAYLTGADTSSGAWIVKGTSSSTFAGTWPSGSALDTGPLYDYATVPDPAADSRYFLAPNTEVGWYDATLRATGRIEDYSCDQPDHCLRDSAIYMGKVITTALASVVTLHPLAGLLVLDHGILVMESNALGAVKQAGRLLVSANAVVGEIHDSVAEVSVTRAGTKVFVFSGSYVVGDRDSDQAVTVTAGHWILVPSVKAAAAGRTMARHPRPFDTAVASQWWTSGEFSPTHLPTWAIVAIVVAASVAYLALLIWAARRGRRRRRERRERRTTTSGGPTGIVDVPVPSAAPTATSPSASGSGAPLGFEDLCHLWISVGGSPDRADVMAAIALAESAGRVDATTWARDGTLNCGLWQVSSTRRDRYDTARLTSDAAYNAVAAREITRNGRQLESFASAWRSQRAQPRGSLRNVQRGSPAYYILHGDHAAPAVTAEPTANP